MRKGHQIGRLVTVMVLGLVGLFLGAAPAHADAGNNGASISGVPFCSNINVKADCWTNENTTAVDCPPAHFCLYTNVTPTTGGKVFALFHCRQVNWLRIPNTRFVPRLRHYVHFPGSRATV